MRYLFLIIDSGWTCETNKFFLCSSQIDDCGMNMLTNCERGFITYTTGNSRKSKRLFGTIAWNLVKLTIMALGWVGLGFFYSK